MGNLLVSRNAGFIFNEGRKGERWKKQYGRASFHENAGENERHPIRDADKSE